MDGPMRVERLWLARLRWRMRGAWLWPAFALLTTLEGVLLEVLPPYGGGPRGVAGGVLLAGFANLFIIAVVAPFAGRRLRRRRPDLPRAIADNYAGTWLVCGLFCVVLAAGLLHRPVAAAERHDRAAQLVAVHDYVISQQPEYQAGLVVADTIRIEDDVYRTCVPGADPKRPLCLYVDTGQSPPGVRLDHDRTPNAAFTVHGGFR